MENAFHHDYDLGSLTQVRPQGHEFSMYVTPRYVHHYEGKEYERFTARFLARVAARHRLFIDVGANYGFYTMLAASEHPELEVMAFEPVEENFEVLRRNVELLGPARVNLHRLAVADTDGTASFHISAAADNCGFSPHPASPNLRQVQVKTNQLDTVLASREPCPTLVKIDVEGHELSVLRGMQETLARFADLSLVLEFNPKMLLAAGTPPEALLAELDRLGFAVFLLDDERCRSYRLKPTTDWSAWVGRLSYANLYCVRKAVALSVCFFSHSPHMGGAERSLLQLVKELVADSGVVCSVVLPGPGALSDALEKAGAACIHQEYGWWGVLPPEEPGPEATRRLEADLGKVLQTILPAVAEINPDLCWTQTMVIPWGAVVAALLGRAHVWSVCEYGELDHGIRFFAPFSRILEDILSSSAFIYTCGKILGDTLFPQAGPDRWRPLHRNVEVPEAGSRREPTSVFLRPGAVHLGMFATLHESKGQEDVVRAVAELVAEGRNVELLLAGYADPAYGPRLEALIAELKIQDHVRLAGFLPDRLEAMRETDVVVVCSRREAFGLVGVEAMKLGKPVVYAAAGGLLEYMVDSRTGISYPPGNATALAEALRQLINHPSEMARLGAEGRTYALSRFNRQSYGGEVYKTLCQVRKESAAARMPGIVAPLLGPAICRLTREQQETAAKLESALAEKTAQAERLAASLEAQAHESTQLELELRDRLTELETLRHRSTEQKPSRLLSSGWQRFVAKQKRSLAKRRAEAHDLLLRGAVRLHWTRRTRQLRGRYKQLRASRLLDEAWYRAKYEHLINRATDPVLHYLESGAAQGCEPNPLFDSEWYLAQNPDVAAAGLYPLFHYLEAGWKEGREPGPMFHPRLYLEANPDIAAAGIEPLAHYLWTGIKENRPLQPGALEVFNREREEANDWPEPDVRLIAFYLPQFHRIPENDTWWGEGFTEWMNVRRGRPQFAGHTQPRVPHPELGYYDLNNDSVLELQAMMARRAGIHGFCFHHYWFAGKRLLEMPVERLLRSGRPDFPFCLCWANENWTRRWDGMESEILVAQRHSPEDDEAFIRDATRFFRDRRYIRIEGRPLLIVYRPLLLPDPAATSRRWRRVCRREGIGEIYLAGVQGFDFSDPRPLGLDAAIEFPPHGADLKPLPAGQNGEHKDFQGLFYDYQQARLNMSGRRVRDFRLFRGVMPSWDNTARRQERASVFINSSPQEYYLWLSQVIRETSVLRKGDERLVFINAWNEWAEGCHLEPDEENGFAWLNATRRALLPAGFVPSAAKPPSFSPDNGKDPVVIIGHDACVAGAQNLLLALLREWKRTLPFPFRLVLVGNGPLRSQYEAICPTIVLTDYPEPARKKAVLAEFVTTQPRLIYSNTVVNGPLLAELRRLGCPIITHVHELQRSIERWAPGEIMQATLRCSDHFIAVSEPVAENLRSKHGVPAKAISTIHAFIDTGRPSADASSAQSLRQDLGVAQDQIVVFGCGTTDWRKGPDLFVETATLACTGDPRLRFLWIGGGSSEEQRKLDGMVRQKGLEGRVRFLGQRSDARDCFALGHIFLLSSREDPFPLVALEAADAALPVICFEGTGGMPGFVENECGFKVPLGDVSAAASAVARLAGDAELRRKLGVAARAKVARCHSTAKAATEITALVERIGPAIAAPTVSPCRPDPLVTVVVPNYNHAPFLPERLESIQRQRFKELEILLLDDASTDGSLAVLEAFARSQPRARVLSNLVNSGSTFKQWRKALSQAKGKYIWIAESDDSAEAGLLDVLIQQLERDPALALACVQSRMIDETGRDLGLPWDWLGDISPTRWRADYTVVGLEEIRRALSIKNTIPNASAVVFHNFKGIEELVDDSLRLCADWLFWVRLCGRGSIFFSASPLNRWRQQTSNARTRPPGELEWEEGRQVIETAAGLLGLSEPARVRLLGAFERRCQGWLAQSRGTSPARPDGSPVATPANSGL